jgi:dihydroflavonol-4-reductase
MENIFITGATGLIGSQVVNLLLERELSTTCLVRQGSDTSRLREVQIVQGDIMDSGSLLEGMRGASHVIHLAAMGDWKNIDNPVALKGIVEGTRNVLTAAKECGISRVLYVSSAAAIDGTCQPRLLDETSPFTLPRKGFLYAHAKREAETVCQDFLREGLPVVIVNPAETYAPEDHRLTTAGNLHRFAKGRIAWVTRGGTGVVHAADVATGILAALERGHPGQRYILSAENLTFAAMAKLVRDTAGLPVKIMEPPTMLLRILSILESPLRLSHGLNTGLIPYVTRYWFMDSQKARQQLGWRPRAGSEAIIETICSFLHPRT